MDSPARLGAAGGEAPHVGGDGGREDQLRREVPAGIV